MKQTIHFSDDECPSVYVAIRDEYDLDVIVFADNHSCIAFCSHHPEYEPMQTGLHTLKSALSLFNN